MQTHIDTTRTAICTTGVLVLIVLGLAACTQPNDPKRTRARDARSCSSSADDADIEALRQLLAMVDRTHYAGSFPDDVPLCWADGPSEYYAYTSYKDRAIYFVRPNFQRDWTYNVLVVMHEMAHFSVGPNHGHDRVWKRELTRLKDPATRVGFKTIRARAARALAMR
jgi:hypothetical protein